MSVSYSYAGVLGWSIILLFFYILSAIMLKKRDKWKRTIKVFTLGIGTGTMIVYIIFEYLFHLNRINVIILEKDTNEVLYIKEDIDEVYSQGDKCITFVSGKTTEKIFYRVVEYEVKNNKVFIYIETQEEKDVYNH